MFNISVDALNYYFSLIKKFIKFSGVQEEACLSDFTSGSPTKDDAAEESDQV